MSEKLRVYECSHSGLRTCVRAQSWAEAMYFLGTWYSEDELSEAVVKRLPHDQEIGAGVDQDDMYFQTARDWCEQSSASFLCSSDRERVDHVLNGDGAHEVEVGGIFEDFLKRHDSRRELTKDEDFVIYEFASETERECLLANLMLYIRENPTLIAPLIHQAVDMAAEDKVSALTDGVSDEDIPDVFKTKRLLNAQQASEYLSKKHGRDIKHPGQFSDLPGGGGRIAWQFDKNPTIERNGVLDTELLTVLIDRLGVFQSTDMWNCQTALAITRLTEARMWLEERQRERSKRGVQFTQEK